MHQYKVHLPQRNTWDHEDSNMMETFFMSGINRDKRNQDENDEVIDLDNNLDLDKN
jgi:hypothetical protein